MQWYESDHGQQRLRLEVTLVHDAFPQMQLIDRHDGRLAWIGVIGPNELTRDRYSVLCTYPRAYMTGRVPVVEILEPTIRSDSPHRFNDGSLCIEHGDFGARDPITDVLGWTMQWLTMYENWLQTGDEW